MFAEKVHLLHCNGLKSRWNSHLKHIHADAAFGCRIVVHWNHHLFDYECIDDLVHYSGLFMLNH